MTNGLDRALREALAPLASRAAAAGLDLDATREYVLAMVRTNSRLGQCTVNSLTEAVAKAVYLGLDLCPAAQEAYLTPRKSRAVLVPDYRGLLKLAYHNPRVGSVESRVVYLRDEFTLEFGQAEGRVVRHRPCTRPLAESEANPAIGAYAILWWKDHAQPLVEWMTAEQIEANAERGGNADEDSPWQTDWAQMARKTVLKRLLNYVPLGRVAADIIRPAVTEAIPAGGGADHQDDQVPVEATTGSELFRQYVESIEVTAPDGFDAVIAAIREDDRLDHEEKTRLFNMAVSRKKAHQRRRT